MPKMLVANELTKSLPGAPPRRLLDAVDLQVAPGEWLAITGESGSGKTTLLNLLAGLDRPDSGRVSLDGRVLTGLTDDGWAAVRRRHYGFVFQAFHILPHLTVAQNVALALWLAGERQDARAESRQVAATLASVGLAGREQAWPRELSGGELQRVAVARAVVHGPAVLLADEPTGNLDAASAALVLDSLGDAVRRAGARGVIVTHSADAAARADRCLRLDGHGRLVAR